MENELENLQYRFKYLELDRKAACDRVEELKAQLAEALQELRAAKEALEFISKDRCVWPTMDTEAHQECATFALIRLTAFLARQEKV